MTMKLTRSSNIDKIRERGRERVSEINYDKYRNTSNNQPYLSEYETNNNENIFSSLLTP